MQTNARAPKRKYTKREERSFGCESVSSGSLTRSCILFLLALSGFVCSFPLTCILVVERASSSSSTPPPPPLLLLLLLYKREGKIKRNVHDDDDATAVPTSSTRHLRVGESRRSKRGDNRWGRQNWKKSVHYSIIVRLQIIKSGSMLAKINDEEVVGWRWEKWILWIVIIDSCDGLLLLKGNKVHVTALYGWWL